MVSTGYLVAMTPIRLKFMGKIKTISVDDFVFTLHYRVTSMLFLVFSVLATCNQFFGNPIECIKGGDIPNNVVNTFCWIEGTFTIPRSLTKAIGTEVAYPGIEKYERFIDDDEVITHKYYQWVAIVLFFQSLGFFIPHLLWKGWEKRRLRIICTDLYKPILTEGIKSKCENILVHHIHETRYKNKTYATRYIFCEILNFLHVLLQFKVTDMFLGGDFINYGLRVLDVIDEDPLARVDPMAKMFPKMTKCTFQRFGPSGSLQRYDNLCILPINILNEKGYLVLWFWLIFVIIVSFVQLLHRAILVASSSYRWSMLSAFNNIIPAKYLEMLQSRSSYGDWFLFHMLSKNLNPIYYRDVIVALAMDPYCTPKGDALMSNTDSNEINTEV
ncbi:Innexin inx2 [Halotydeus destructor]|nr:Innexin inx2 [Halotydeus destructor]